MKNLLFLLQSKHMKIISWNVNGIRAWKDKPGSLGFIHSESADIVCFQETKAQDDQVAEAIASVRLSGYQIYSNSAVKKGYSGTAILTKTEPISISYDSTPFNTPESCISYVFTGSNPRILELRTILISAKIGNSGCEKRTRFK